jgi:phage head maturation protease
MILLLSYTAVILAFLLGRMMGHRQGSRPNEERYNRGWLDGYDIGRRTARPDTPAKQPVPPMVNTTTSAALTPVTMIHTPKRPPAKIRAKRKVTK